jgi:hypothetical protein
LAAVALLRAVAGRGKAATADRPLARGRAPLRKALREVQHQLAHLNQRGKLFGAFEDAKALELEHQATVLRDVLGPPSQVPEVVPGWLAWGEGTVPRLAAGIRAEQAFDQLSILADALEDAGCQESAVLAHCRGSGPHVRGCWVLSWALTKAAPREG